jgi:AcrR family transcriptional regulator
MSPRSKQQFEVMREKGRDKILAAALKLFAENGYETTSIDDVVKRAKVSKGSAYHYFTSKEALLKAVVVNGLSGLGALMERVEAVKSPNEKLVTFINVSFEMLDADKKVWKLYFSLLTQTTLPRSVRNVLQPMIAEMLVYMEKLFKDIGAQDAAGESRILAAMLDGVFLHYLLLGPGYPLDDMRQKILSRYS